MLCVCAPPSLAFSNHLGKQRRQAEEMKWKFHGWGSFGAFVKARTHSHARFLVIDQEADQKLKYVQTSENQEANIRSSLDLCLTCA